MQEDLEQTLRALAKKWDAEAAKLVQSTWAYEPDRFDEGRADGLEQAATDLIRILGRK